MDAELAVILLAAGESRRMGTPKLLLPWGEKTVLGQVIDTFAAGLASILSGWEIVVITGGAHEQIEALVAGYRQKYPIRTVINSKYSSGGMLSSLQVGVRSLGPSVNAALIGLGDQPQARPETIQDICAAWSQSAMPLVIPSHEQRRGHPWLVARPLWQDILSLPADATPRRFLNEHAGEAVYVPADESILHDLDTPEEYRRLRP